ncbi:MAG: DUF3106 domain-containing protein [Proteobacteria bacterium]|nr:DUF3106 domain-containing protein [Pseudomonadota bacterium]
MTPLKAVWIEVGIGLKIIWTARAIASIGTWIARGAVSIIDWIAKAHTLRLMTEQRQQARQRMQRWQQMTPEQQQQLRRSVNGSRVCRRKKTSGITSALSEYVTRTAPARRGSVS